MMFIAEDPETRVIRIETPAIFDPQGRLLHEKKRRLSIKFQRGYAPQWVKDVALKTFEFRKRPVEIPPETWVAYYDSLEDQVSHGWTDEERAEIERVLLESPGILQIEEPQLEKPWPSIDKLTVTKTRPIEDVAVALAQTASEIGVELAEVAAYVAQNIGKHGWTADLATSLRAAAGDPEDAEDLVPA